MANPSCNAHARLAESSSIEPPMYKNKLQEYTQKHCLPFPAYRTANEGSQHAPKFRTTVFVDGSEYTSKLTFRRLKEAEQDAAKLALDCIMSNSKQLVPTKPLLDQDPKSSKSELHELAFKKQWDIPKYSTRLSETEGSVPVFVSTVMVGAQNFTGNEAKNKRDAEQFAAHAALQSLHAVGTDSRDIPANQMMSSKKRGCDARGKIGFTDFKRRKLTSNPRDNQVPRPSVALPQQRGFKRKLEMTLRKENFN